MDGPYRVFIWALAVFGGSLPYMVLDFFLPTEMLKSSTRLSRMLDVPDKLIADFAFIGVAVFLACVPDWLDDGHFKSFKLLRKRAILFFRSACFAFAFASLCYYIRISMNFNHVYGAGFTFDLYSNKLALFWCVVAVGASSFTAVTLHLGRSQQRAH